MPRVTVPMALSNGTKKRLAEFHKTPEIAHWKSVFKGTSSSFALYSKYFMQYLGTETPASFLQGCKQDPDKASMVIDAKLTAIYRVSTSKANQTAFAILSFLKSHKIKGVEIDTKALKIVGKRQQNYLSFEDAQAIIAEADQPYRQIFTFMVWSGLGSDEIGEVQTSKEIQQTIELQRTNDKHYVRINMRARKSARKPFYTLVPKDQTPIFPLLTHKIGLRGGTLVKPYDLRENWRRAAKKAKLWQPGIGPHILMSVFESTAGMAGTNQAAVEMCRGHRAGDVYGYARQAQNEEWMASELQKYWSYSKPATRKEVQRLEEENKILKESIIPTLLREKETLERELQELRPSVPSNMVGFMVESEETKAVKRRIEEITRQLKALGA